MKIKPEQAERLTGDLLRGYRSKELIVFKVQEGDVRNKIKDIIIKNFHEEEAIEEEARAMLATHAGEMRRAGEEMDQHKMFLLIKQKIAEKKGFVL